MYMYIQGGSNMTGTDVARFTHKQYRLYLNHPVYVYIYIYIYMEYRVLVVKPEGRNHWGDLG